jgi:hypothetical protein
MQRRAARQARSDVLWCVAGFCALQAGLVLVMEHLRPEFRDLEYGSKRALLRERLRENPGRPLALVLGSSRVLSGLRPDLLPPCPTPQGQAVVFNFGMTGNGPLHQLLCLRRLLAEGYRPRWVVVEVLPALFPLEYTGEELIKVERQGWADLALLRGYFADPARLYVRWAESRLVPWFSCRFCLLNRYLPAWVPRDWRVEDLCNTLDGCGWGRLPSRLSAAERERGLRAAWQQHAPVLQQFHIAGTPDRALRQLLGLCRQKRIDVALLLMPEGTAFQSWYPPSARAGLKTYLATLTRDYGVPVIDAQGWVPEEDFCDSHHLRPEGAALFSERFGRQALRPFLAGRLPAGG